MPEENKPISTIVTVNGKTFELKDMTKEKGAELYEELGQVKDEKGNLILNKEGKPNYQALANVMAAIAENYDSIISVELDKGVTIEGAINELSVALKEGKGKLSEATARAKPYLKALSETGLGKVLAHNPVTNTVDGLGSFLKNLQSLGTGFTDYSVIDMVPGSIGVGLHSLKNKGDDLLRGMRDRIDPEQAKALGSAYAASVLNSEVTETGEKIYKPDFFDKIWAGLGTGLGHIGHFLKQHIPAIPAAFKYMGKGFKDWDGCMDEARKEADEKVKSYDERLDENSRVKVAKRTRQPAAERLEAAGTIAGVKTAPLAMLAANGGIYCDENGTFHKIDFDNNALPHDEPLKDKDGNPVTANTEQKEKLKQLFPQNMWETAGLALKTSLQVSFVAGGVRGYASILDRSNVALVKKYDNLMEGVNTLRADAKALEATDAIKAAELNKKADALYKTIEPEAKLLETKIAARQLEFGENFTKLAGTSMKEASLVTRTGNLMGKPIGFASKSLYNGFNGTAKLFGFERPLAITKTPLYGSYVYDGGQGLMDLMTGDWHGVAENSAQIAAAKYGWKLGGKTATWLDKELLEMAPGRAKIFVLGTEMLAGWFARDQVTNLTDMIPGKKDEKKTDSKKDQETKDGLNEAGVNYTKNAEDARNLLLQKAQSGDIDLSKFDKIKDYNLTAVPSNVDLKSLQSQMAGFSNSKTGVNY